jgi:hypothetical protein
VETHGVCSGIRNRANSEIITSSFILVTEALKAKIVRIVGGESFVYFHDCFGETARNVMANVNEIVTMHRVCGSWRVKPL